MRAFYGGGKLPPSSKVVGGDVKSFIPAKAKKPALDKEVISARTGFHMGGGGGAQGFPLPSESESPPPQNFESLCTILYGFMVLGDFSWSFD